MSGITLKKTVAASIPTPATDKATIFLDDATDAPAYKDDTGTTTPIGGTSGAPTTADYLVGTSQAGLSAEIIVGATPGGELGGTWATPTVDATHSGSSHAGTQTAAEATAASALSAHTADTTDAHDASAVSIVDTGGYFTGTEVEAALQELGASGGSGAPTAADYLVGTSQAGLSAEIIVGTSPGGELGGTWASPTIDTTHSGSSHAGTQTAAEATAASALSAHTGDTTDAHDASAVSIVDAGSYFTGTEVEAALQELGAGSGGPIVTVADGGTVSHSVASLAAGAALIAAIAALPTTSDNAGGIIQLGHGFYCLADSGAGSQLDLTDLSQVWIRGVGGITGGAAAGTVIETYNTGSGEIVVLADTTNCGFSDMMIWYQSTLFTGTLLSTAASTIQATSLRLNNVILWGRHDAGETAVLLNLSRSIIGQFNRVFFNGAGIGVLGHRSVAVTGMTVANPTVVTAPGHGFTTGEKIDLGGVVTTPPTSVSPPNVEPATATVIDANSFSLPYNVTVVTDGVGFATSNGDFSNVQSFDTCKWIRTGIMPVRNPGEAWRFDNCTFQALESGDVGAIDHNPGNRFRALTISGGGNYDQTTTNAGSIFKLAGSGLTITGFNASGRSTSQITFLEIDEDATQGVFVAGNNLNAIYRGIQFGTTVAHIRGQFGPNSYDNDRTSYLPVDGTLPLGISIVPSDQDTKPDTFWWAGGNDGDTGSSFIQFDNDTTVRLNRSSAGVLNTGAQLQAGGRLIAGSGQAAGTQVYGQSGETVGGLISKGTNAQIDLFLDQKGSTSKVKINTNAPTATAGIQLAGHLEIIQVISPTQLVANTDDWNPTSLATAYLIRVNVDAARSITGIAAQPVGTVLRLHNTTTFTITLVHNATSTAANRFFCPGAVDFPLLPKASVDLLYTSADGRWLVISQGRSVQTVRFAAGVPSGAPTGTELPIAFDSTGVTGGVYYWTGAAWVKGGTI